MTSTITQKILARAAGVPFVLPGEEILVTPDFVMAYELRGVTDKLMHNLADTLGVAQLRNPEKHVMFIDHRVPARTTQDVELHAATRRWASVNGVSLFEAQGIGHQVAVEQGYVSPGAVVVHFDAHVMQVGAFGALGFGLRSQIIQAYAQGQVTLTVPASARVRFTGRLHPWCHARDVLHEIILRLGMDGCLFRVLEFDGRHLGGLNHEDLQAITGMAMFTGAVSAIVNRAPAWAAAEQAGQSPCSDEDADYAPDIWVDLNGIVPTVALPPTPAHVQALDGLQGMEVQVGYLGSCASGRLGDLRAAADILRGRRVAPGFSLHVVPTSQAIMAQAQKEGILDCLTNAGAHIAAPSCDFCSGYNALAGPGQRAVSTGTLNVMGRMGAADSEILLCSPYTLAATAVAGRLADPRDVGGMHG